MSYKPPFTLTSEILNRVVDISAQMGRQNASALNASPQLRKQNRSKTITGTLAVEGNTLTEEQIATIVDGKPVLPLNAPVSAPVNAPVNVAGRKSPGAILLVQNSARHRAPYQLVKSSTTVV